MGQASTARRHEEEPAAAGFLERLGEYRRAARTAVHAAAPVKTRCLALLDLGAAARAEEERTARDWAERAVWEEARDLLGHGEPPPELPGDPYERRARQLRAQGYSRCPRCLAELPGDVELERWAELRRVHREQVEARERAVG